MFPAARAALLLLLVALTTLSLGAAGRELAPRVIAETPNTTYAPVTAFSGDRFLTVWAENLGLAGTAVRGAFSDRSGRRIASSAIALRLRVGDPLSMELVGAGDGGFALFWRGYDEDAQMALIDRDGRVTAVRTVDLPDYVTAKVKWNGTHFLAVVQPVGTLSIEAAVLDREGRTVRGDIRFPRDVYGREVVANADHFVLFASQPNGLIAWRITSNGIEASTVVDSTGPAWTAAAATADGDVLVVWSRMALGLSEMRSAFLRRDGSVTTPRVISTAPNAVQIPLEVMHTGSGYVVAYGRRTTTDIKTGVIRLGASGEPVGTPEPPSLPPVYPADAASNGETLLIAYQPRTLPVRTSTIAVNAAGQARAPEVVAFNDSRQTQPVLATGGGDAVAAWTEIAGDTATVRIAHVDAEGNATAVYNIANGHLAADGLAWSGTQYLAVYRDGSSLLATRIAAHGAPIDATPLVIDTLTSEGSEVPASVIWAGDRWLIIWGDGVTLRRASVSAAGAASTPRALPVHAPAREYWERSFLSPSLAFDGEHVLLGSTVADLPPCMMPVCEEAEVEVIAALLASNGSPVDSAVLDVEQQVRTSVASSGTNFLLLAGTRAFVIDARGTRLRIAIDRQLFDWPAQSDVTWDGTNYVVALRYAGSNWHLAVRRLNRAANDVTAARGTQTLAPLAAAQPSLVPLFAGDALIGLQEGTADDGMRAVVYRERDLTPLP
ncbi:MAG TPA: hypothetical protein VE010_22150, partial [Thermoanaerobaculia bacterium]|nr:hypothetical protein [Thermoanaerobaculia bacterium]